MIIQINDGELIVGEIILGEIMLKSSYDIKISRADHFTTFLALGAPVGEPLETRTPLVYIYIYIYR